MTEPFAIISDVHLHKWSAFSTINERGINSRLDAILSEIHRCADTLRKQGGNVIYVAGDLFHVRGNVSPEVLNPTLDVFEALTQSGFEFRIIPGNHDLEGKDSNRLGAAVTALEHVGCKLAHVPTYFEDHSVYMVPWIQDLGALSKLLRDSLAENIILHAPMNGVLTGVPETGLDHTVLGDLEANRVFVGHYHNHKDFGNGVYSVGATTHQTWSDVGTKAGFLIVSGDNVRWYKSHAPSFVDLDPDEEDIPSLVDGNYVRVRMEVEKDSQIAEMRKLLTDSGALGVVIHPIKKTTTVSRTGSTIKSGASLIASVGDFIKSKRIPAPERVFSTCEAVLATVTSRRDA